MRLGNFEKFFLKNRPRSDMNTRMVTIKRSSLEKKYPARLCSLLGGDHGTASGLVLFLIYSFFIFFGPPCHLAGDPLDKNETF